MQNGTKLDDDKALEATLQGVLAETGVPGIGAAIAMQGRTIAAAAGIASGDSLAPLTTSSRFELSCLMKFFVSLVMLDFASSGALSLNSPIAEFLPEFDNDPDAKSRNITIGNLLSHTSGYRGLDITDMKVRWSYNWARFVEHFLAFPPSFPAGSVFNYEHSEHVIAGEILRRITGQSARDLVADRILGPLGITIGRARSDKDDPNCFVANHVFSASKGAFSTVSLPPFGAFWDASLPDATIALRDVARVASALMNSEEPQRLALSHSVVTRLLAPVIDIPRGVPSDRQSEQIPHSFGTGCAQYGAGVLGHNGSMVGQTSALRFDPQTGLAVIVGVNARSTFARDIAMQRIWADVANGRTTGPEVPAERSFPLNKVLADFTLDEVCGHYVGSYLGEAAVTRDANSLRVDVGPSGNRRASFQIVPASGDGGDVYKIESPFPVSVVFSRNVNEPALFLGVHSYKKIL